MKVETTKQKVLDASKTSVEAKDMLKELFPEAFNIQYREGKLYAFHSCGGIYKLHRVEDRFAFIDLKSSECYANGTRKTAQQMIDNTNNVVEFNNHKEFAIWINQYI